MVIHSILFKMLVLSMIFDLSYVHALYIFLYITFYWVNEKSVKNLLHFALDIGNK